MTALLERVYAWRWSVLPPITGVAMMAMIVGALVAAPREIIEGEVQRLMYLHVPAAIIMYVAFFFTAFASVMLLWKRDIRWDAAARASAIVGVFLCGIVLFAITFVVNTSAEVIRQHFRKRSAML